MRFGLKNSRLVRTIGLTILASCSVFALPQSASADSYVNLQSIQYNVDHSSAQIKRAIQKGKALGVPNIFLQEVCQKQAERLLKKYDSTYGGPWTVAVASGNITSQCNGLVYNVAIVTTPGLEKYVYDLDPDPKVLAGSMACVKYDALGRTWISCSTHVASKNTLTGDDRAKQRIQINTIRSNAVAWNSFGWVVTIGGDFNTKPDESNINRLYNSQQGGSGPFTEFNRNGAHSNTRVGKWTAQSGAGNRRKIDYVFHGLAHTGYTYNFGESVPQPRKGSPHRMIIDNARVVVP